MQEQREVLQALAAHAMNSQGTVQDIDAALQELAQSDLSSKARAILTEAATKERALYAEQLQGLETLWKAIE